MSLLKTKFSHVRPGETPYRDEGLRNFFQYRDLGVADATNGMIVAHLVRAKNAPEIGTGWHVHQADFQIVIMLRGWARFMYEDQETLVSAGDCVQQAPGIRHYLFDYSEDMEYLEIVSPADFKSFSVDGPCPVPKPRPWPTKDET
jgi:mannose-6-phosphate isomerase-like protein (cupin superfamily)